MLFPSVVTELFPVSVAEKFGAPKKTLSAHTSERTCPCEQVRFRLPVTRKNLDLTPIDTTIELWPNRPKSAPSF